MKNYSFKIVNLMLFLVVFGTSSLVSVPPLRLMDRSSDDSAMDDEDLQPDGFDDRRVALRSRPLMAADPRRIDDASQALGMIEGKSTLQQVLDSLKNNVLELQQGIQLLEKQVAVANDDRVKASGDAQALVDDDNERLDEARRRQDMQDELALAQ